MWAPSVSQVGQFVRNLHSFLTACFVIKCTCIAKLTGSWLQFLMTHEWHCLQCPHIHFKKALMYAQLILLAKAHHGPHAVHCHSHLPFRYHPAALGRSCKSGSIKWMEKNIVHSFPFSGLELDVFHMHSNLVSTRHFSWGHHWLHPICVVAYFLCALHSMAVCVIWDWWALRTDQSAWCRTELHILEWNFVILCGTCDPFCHYLTCGVFGIGTACCLLHDTLQMNILCCISYGIIPTGLWLFLEKSLWLNMTSTTTRLLVIKTDQVYN